MPLDLKDSIRSLLNRPGLTVVIIATLALAIGVNATIFSALNAVLLKPFDYAAPDRLVTIWESNQDLGIERDQVSAATYVDWRERSETLSALAAYRYRGSVLTEGPEPVRIGSMDVSPALFEVLGVPPYLGRSLQPEDERPNGPRVAVISFAAWSRRFGSDSTIVDKRILLDSEPFAVVGIMPEAFRFPADDPSVEVWTPLTLSLEDLPSRPHRMYDVVGRLSDDATLTQAREEMGSIADRIAQEHPESNTGWGVTLTGLQTYVTGASARILWFLQGAVALVLLIGCVNIANLLLAKSMTQSGDYAIRAAFGATGRDLLKRSLLESMTLALVGGAVGLLVAVLGIAFLRDVIPSTVPRADDIRLDAAVLTFTIVATSLSGLVFGLAPGLRSMHPKVAQSLQETGNRTSPGRKSRWLTNSLVLTEVALALLLLVGAGLMIRSFVALSSVDPGFRTSDVTAVAISLPQSRYAGSDRQRQFYLALSERVRRIPGLQHTGGVSALPLSPIGTEFEMPFSRAGLEASSPSERPRADYRAVLAGYFETMGIPLIHGRVFTTFEDDDRPVAVINEALRDRYFDDINPIGQMLLRAPMIGDLEIVGVVGNVRHGSLAAEARPEMYVPFVQLPLSEMHIVVHARDGSAAAAAIRAEVLSMDAELPVTATTGIDELMSVSVAQDRFNMVLLTGLATTAVVLAAVGIFGVVSYTVARRTGEIGLRMALGADGADTLWLIVRQVLSVVGTGVAVGFVVALLLGRFIKSMLFGVTPVDPVTYILVGLLLIGIGVAAAAYPALRATRVDPVVALRGSAHA